MPPEHNVPPQPDPALHQGPVTPTRGSRVSLRLLVALVVLAAAVGAGVALAVAHATGWGNQPAATRSSTGPTGLINNEISNIAGIVNRVVPGVVLITATEQPSPFYFEGGSSAVTAVGTGIILTANGEVVTNDHVVSDATSITVTLHDSTKALPTTVVGELPQYDLALLQIEGVKNLSPVDLGDSTKVTVGDEALTIGYALGLEGGPSVTEGIISATDRQVETETSTGQSVTLKGMIQTSAPISSGNSGGPLINDRAQVIGINTVVATSSANVTAQNIGFAIPSNEVKNLLPTLRRGGA